MQQMNNSKVIKVFIGSPSDTNRERSKISEIIDDLNQTLGYKTNILVQPVMWEHDVRPTVGLDGQDVINSQTQDYDIFVGMMWKKYGSPTSRAGSATDEEYTHALNSFRNGGHCKDIIFMFSKMQFGIDDVDPGQLTKVKAFRERVEKDGVLHKDYDSVDDFVRQLRVALYQSIMSLEQSSSIKEQSIPKVMRLDKIDEKTKLVFDTLSISPAVNSVKMKFIESYILLFLYDNETASSTDIIKYLMDTLGGANEHLYNNVLGKLNQTDSLYHICEGTRQFGLTEKKREEIAQIKEKARLSMDKVSQECQIVCKKYNLQLDVRQINIYVCNLFATNYSNDTGEFCRCLINREASLKQIYSSLVQYIQNASRLPFGFVEPIAKEIVGVYSKNQVFYKSNVSRMFLNLFHNEKLETYLATTQRDLILDTQVLLRICCVSFDEIEPASIDIMYKVGRRFWDIVRENPKIKLYTTSGYVQEVASHMKQAVELSRFLSLDYIQKLGPSKNVFFNHYLSIKDDLQNANFEDYVYEMLDIEVSAIQPSAFLDKAFSKFSSFFQYLNIDILQHMDVADYNLFKKEYENELSYQHTVRSYTARTNDVNAAIIAGNRFNDFDNYPYLVTSDSMFVRVRDRFVEKFSNQLSFFYVFPPQKISEMISLIDFKVDPNLVDENIISLTESNFNSSNDTISFLDLLNSIIDKRELSDWKLAKKLSNLRDLCRGSIGDESLSSTNLPIDEIIYEILQHSFKQDISTSDINELFCDNDYADEISALIQAELKDYKIGINPVKNDTFKKLEDMVLRRKKKQCELGKHCKHSNYA